MRSFHLAILITLTFVLITQPVRTSSQVNGEQERLIELSSFPGEPVKITIVKNKRREFRVGEKFKDTNDWFKDLTVRVKNTSDKPVNYLSILITFIRPKEQKEAGRLPFGESLIYGKSPMDLDVPTPSNHAPLIPPGGSIELSLPEIDFENYKALLKKLDFPEAVLRMEISVQEAGFEDGLLWSGGVLWQRDPNNRTKIIPLPKKTGETKPLPFNERLPTQGAVKSQANVFRNALWVPPQPRQTSNCSLTGPEFTLNCNYPSTCWVRDRVDYYEPSSSQLPEIINQ